MVKDDVGTTKHYLLVAAIIIPLELDQIYAEVQNGLLHVTCQQILGQLYLIRTHKAAGSRGCDEHAFTRGKIV